jgi:hypothetical protein
MKLTTIAAYLFWLAAAAFLMRFELHTDDTGIVVLSILVITFVLGFFHPRHAWQWALLVGPCIPAAHLIFGAQGTSLHTVKDFALLTCFVLAVGFAGSYSGVLARKLIWPRSEAGPRPAHS